MNKYEENFFELLKLNGFTNIEFEPEKWILWVAKDYVQYGKNNHRKKNKVVKHPSISYKCDIRAVRGSKTYYFEVKGGFIHQHWKLLKNLILDYTAKHKLNYMIVSATHVNKYKATKWYDLTRYYSSRKDCNLIDWTTLGK